MLPFVTECYRVLQSVTEYYRVLQSITEYNRVLQSITEIYRLLQSITARASPGAFGWMATHFKTANLVLNYFRFTATLSLSSVLLQNCLYFLTLYSNFMNLLLPSQKQQMVLQHFLAMWKQNMTIKQIFMLLLKFGASAYGWSRKMKCCIFCWIRWLKLKTSLIRTHLLLLDIWLH